MVLCIVPIFCLRWLCWLSMEAKWHRLIPNCCFSKRNWVTPTVARHSHSHVHEYEQNNLLLLQQRTVRIHTVHTSQLGMAKTGGSPVPLSVSEAGSELLYWLWLWLFLLVTCSSLSQRLRIYSVESCLTEVCAPASSLMKATIHEE